MRVCGVVLCVYVHMIRVTASRTWVSILWANLIIPTAVIVLYIPWTPRLLRARVAVWCVCVCARACACCCCCVCALLHNTLAALIHHQKATPPQDCVCVVTTHFYNTLRYIGSAHASSKSNSSTRLPSKLLSPATTSEQPQANNHKRTTTAMGISVPYVITC